MSFFRNWENMAPRARFELATLRLTAECSTVELLRSKVVSFHFDRPLLAVSNLGDSRPNLWICRSAVALECRGQQIGDRRRIARLDVAAMYHIYRLPILK